MYYNQHPDRLKYSKNRLAKPKLKKDNELDTFIETWQLNMQHNDYQRIEKSIHFIEENFARQPSLNEIAEYAGLSEYHFQRLFKRWAGISPKRFVQYLTAQYSGALLRTNMTLLDTSMEAGLSSTGRLHDLFVNVYAMTPDEYRREAKNLKIRYGWYSSPFGNCLAGKTDRGICWLSFHDKPDRDGIEQMQSQWKGASFVESDDAIKNEMNQMFGNEHDVTTPFMVHLKGTNLQIRVWEALLKIPQGKLISYSYLAEVVERPDAVRAVASAVGRNAVSYLVPCHRVIRQSGGLGGYRWGLTRKKAILARESLQSCWQETG